MVDQKNVKFEGSEDRYETYSATSESPDTETKGFFGTVNCTAKIIEEKTPQAENSVSLEHSMLNASGRVLASASSSVLPSKNKSSTPILYNLIEKPYSTNGTYAVSAKGVAKIAEGAEVVSKAELTFIIDSSAPSIETKFDSGKWYNEGSVPNIEIEIYDQQKSGESPDTVGLQKISYRIEDNKGTGFKDEFTDIATEPLMSIEGGSYITHDTSKKKITISKEELIKLGDGEHVFVFAARDKVGNVSEDLRVTVKYDNTAPVLEFTEMVLLSGNEVKSNGRPLLANEYISELCPKDTIYAYHKEYTTSSVVYEHFYRGWNHGGSQMYVGLDYYAPGKPRSKTGPFIESVLCSKINNDQYAFTKADAVLSSRNDISYRITDISGVTVSFSGTELGERKKKEDMVLIPESGEKEIIITVTDEAGNTSLPKKVFMNIDDIPQVRLSKMGWVDLSKESLTVTGKDYLPAGVERTYSIIRGEKINEGKPDESFLFAGKSTKKTFSSSFTYDSKDISNPNNNALATGKHALKISYTDTVISTGQEVKKSETIIPVFIDNNDEEIYDINFVVPKTVLQYITDEDGNEYQQGMFGEKVYKNPENLQDREKGKLYACTEEEIEKIEAQKASRKPIIARCVPSLYINTPERKGKTLVGEVALNTYTSDGKQDFGHFVFSEKEGAVVSAENFIGQDEVSAKETVLMDTTVSAFVDDVITELAFSDYKITPRDEDVFSLYETEEGERAFALSLGDIATVSPVQNTEEGEEKEKIFTPLSQKITSAPLLSRMKVKAGTPILETESGEGKAIIRINDDDMIEPVKGEVTATDEQVSVKNDTGVVSIPNYFVTLSVLTQANEKTKQDMKASHERGLWKKELDKINNFLNYTGTNGKIAKALESGRKAVIENRKSLSPSVSKTSRVPTQQEIQAAFSQLKKELASNDEHLLQEINTTEATIIGQNKAVNNNENITETGIPAEAVITLVSDKKPDRENASSQAFSINRVPQREVQKQERIKDFQEKCKEDTIQVISSNGNNHSTIRKMITKSFVSDKKDLEESFQKSYENEDKFLTMRYICGDIEKTDANDPIFYFEENKKIQTLTPRIKTAPVTISRPTVTDSSVDITLTSTQNIDFPDTINLNMTSPIKTAIFWKKGERIDKINVKDNSKSTFSHTYTIPKGFIMPLESSSQNKIHITGTRIEEIIENENATAFIEVLQQKPYTVNVSLHTLEPNGGTVAVVTSPNGILTEKTTLNGKKLQKDESGQLFTFLEDSLTNNSYSSNTQTNTQENIFTVNAKFLDLASFSEQLTPTRKTISCDTSGKTLFGKTCEVTPEKKQVLPVTFYTENGRLYSYYPSGSRNATRAYLIGSNEKSTAAQYCASVYNRTQQKIYVSHTTQKDSGMPVSLNNGRFTVGNWKRNNMTYINTVTCKSPATSLWK
jgi:hypothetical protein